MPIMNLMTENSMKTPSQINMFHFETFVQMSGRPTKTVIAIQCLERRATGIAKKYPMLRCKL